jgi:hypothetical protein
MSLHFRVEKMGRNQEQLGIERGGSGLVTQEKRKMLPVLKGSLLLGWRWETRGQIFMRPRVS